MTQEMKEVTLIHEILHCLDLEMEHNAVEMLSQSLYQIFKENDLLK